MLHGYLLTPLPIPAGKEYIPLQVDRLAETEADRIYDRMMANVLRPSTRGRKEKPHWILQETWSLRE